MNHVPFVSIIIPNYNYAQYLGEAIGSALGQTYQAIEVVVVDDGSTDDSVLIAKKYGDQIRLIEQENRGVVAARNRGLAEAQGEFVCFLDADDVMASGYVERLVKALTEAEEKAGVAYCDFQLTGNDTTVVKSCQWNPRKLLYRNYIVASAMVRKSAIEEVGGFSDFPSKAVSFEDWDVWLKLVEAGYTGVYVPEVLFCYRIHGTGRNTAGLAQRRELEQGLRQRHRGLYTRWDNQIYLAVFGTASKIRNLLVRAPGT